jgi:uncharacterized protein YbaA (DUF1428 family)
MLAVVGNTERSRDAARKSESRREGREIGRIPDVVKPRRKGACRRSFRKFCGSYFGQTFTLPWSADHRKVIGQIEESVLRGGLFATAMPRGSGKTTLAEIACLWACFYGHREFVALIGSSEDASLQMFDSIKAELEGNDLLLEDFPEAIYPIRCLEGIAHRCLGQTHNGERTHIGWTADELVMPTVPGSKASGVIIKVRGITGNLRGMKFKRTDGRSVRPDLVIVDDPQTDQSANSPSQCETRERILAGAILGLAGPGRKIAGILPCTVIRPGDMADRILNRKLHPEWNGTRTKLVYSFPTAEKLWEEYGRIRSESLQAGACGKEATEFYRANRAAMDAGAVVAWKERFEPDELSAVQHAMNLRLRDPRAFAAEYQNEPIVDEDSRADELTSDQIAGRVNRVPRGVVPIGASRLTAFVDVQGSLLYWLVAAWADDFTGYVIDYGAHPDQKRSYFSLRDADPTLAKVVPNAGLEGQIYGGLQQLAARILGKSWARDDGAEMKVERCLVDANWGASTDTIYDFVRQSAFAAVLSPSHGKYIGAASVPMREWQRKPGDRIGMNWRVPGTQGKRAVRHIIYDTNFWKAFIHARFSTAMGDKGGLSLFGDRPHDHRLLADHLLAEYRVRTQGRGREVDEWKIRPERPDNHWLDCLVGCAVAASMQGVSLGESSPTPTKKVKASSWAEFKRRQAERLSGKV